MLNEKEEKIMQLVRMSGPTLPNVVAKQLNTEIYLASAILSGLVQNGHLKLSFRRIGSSPLYYVPGQENKVRERLHKELNELEKKALERIRDLKVAFTEELYPQERFLVSELKDFVEALTINSDGQELKLWKHYSVSQDELNSIISSKLHKTEPKQELTQLEVQQTLQPTAQQSQAVEEMKPLSIFSEPPKQETVEVPKPKRVRKEHAPKQDSEFERKVHEYLKEKKIEIISTKGKKGETIHEASLPTALGSQNLLVKISGKANVAESDISTFYTECLHLKKPGIIFVSNELSKKTRDFVSKNIGEFVKIIKM
ncbi:MAG: hypothetical protein PHC66_04305 [Candidatus Nanoarchaeia archaeon]|nr:hypothetical protein [Candidatus Nanoarchaeia archaeon]MDD5239367.1 hypothetical protein [Candidatus Nanoarchaeia archaeon]